MMSVARQLRRLARRVLRGRHVAWHAGWRCSGMFWSCITGGDTRWAGSLAGSRHACAELVDVLRTSGGLHERPVGDGPGVHLAVLGLLLRKRCAEPVPR